MRVCSCAHYIARMNTAEVVPPITIGDRLRIARRYAGLEQEELAEIICVSRGTVSNAELGRVKPRRITLRAWAGACGVPLAWIEHDFGPWCHI